MRNNDRLEGRKTEAIPVPEELLETFLTVNYNFPQTNTANVPALALKFLELFPDNSDPSLLFQMRLSENQIDRMMKEAEGHHAQRRIAHPTRKQFIELWYKQVYGTFRLIVRLWNALKQPEITLIHLDRYVASLDQAFGGSVDRIRLLVRPMQEAGYPREIFEKMGRILATMNEALYSPEGIKIAAAHAQRMVRAHLTKKEDFDVTRAALQGGKELNDLMKGVVLQKFPELPPDF